MFPIKDVVFPERQPYAAWFLMLINFIVFIYITEINFDISAFLDFSLVPARLGMPESVIPIYDKVYPFFTYMFLHGSVFSLLISAYFILVFSGNIEDKLGHFVFFIAYICFGLLAGVAQVYYLPTSGYPVSGASGAIAGILGLYAGLFPKSRMRTIPGSATYSVHTMFYIVIWVLWQVREGYFGSYSLDDGDTAWCAKLTSFAAGLILAFLLRYHRRYKES